MNRNRYKLLTNENSKIQVKEKNNFKIGI